MGDELLANMDYDYPLQLHKIFEMAKQEYV